MHETLAKVSLKYGSAGREGYTDNQISEFWNYDDDGRRVRKKIKLKLNDGYWYFVFWDSPKIFKCTLGCLL